ncbi:2-hydroxyisocaproyl-CoA dehydratase activator [Methanosarcinales archaeon]|nr:2-hydroxyisocaproyl-CoA dehydratase activator [Methanosarcinales archaeon]
MISIGIDAGAATTKVVVLRDNEIAGYAIIPTGFDFRQAGEAAYREVLSNCGIGESEVGKILATGYGRSSIGFAEKTISEITAHARGVGYLIPAAHTIIDIGGQDSKVIITENGKVVDFLMNDRCAAGTGKFLEYTAKALEISLNELGTLALVSKHPAKISSMCTVFVESEVISLRAQKTKKEDIAAGLIESIILRTTAMVKKLGIKPELAFVGGVAKNPGVVKAFEKALDIEMQLPEEPQITGALGAALVV